MTKSTIPLAILNSVALIIKAFLGQAFDENVFLKSHYGLKNTFILQYNFCHWLVQWCFGSIPDA